MPLRLPWPPVGVTEAVMKDQQGDAGIDHGVIAPENLEQLNSSAAMATVQQQQCCMMVGFKPCAIQPLSLVADCTQTGY